MVVRRMCRAAIALLWVWCLLLCGCGGGGGGTSDLGGQGGGGTPLGQITFRITWADHSREVPADVASISLQMWGPGDDQTRTIERPTEGNCVEVTFTNLPAGEYHYRADGYAEAGAQGNRVGEVYATRTLQAGEQATVILDMERLTSSNIYIQAPNDTYAVTVGSNVTLSGYAIVQGVPFNELVPLRPGSARWSSTNTAVATIDADGNVTGIAPGETRIKLVDTDSSGEASLRFFVLDPNAQPGTWRVEITADKLTGDAYAIFRFDARLLNGTQAVDDFQVRWDFDGDGRYDTPFLSEHHIEYQYQDFAGGAVPLRAEVKTTHNQRYTGTLILSVTRPIVPVELSVSVTPQEGTTATEFVFAGNGGREDPQAILYGYFRIDWNRDGLYDTPWTYYNAEPFPGNQLNEVIRHRFDQPGTYTVSVQITAREQEYGNTHDLTVRVLP